MAKILVDHAALYKLNKNDVQKASRTLAEAFFDYPFFSAVIEEKNRMEALVIMLEMDIRYALKRGAAYSLDSELNEIATWHFNYGKAMDLIGYLSCITPRTFKLFGLIGGEKLNVLRKTAEEIEEHILKLDLPKNTVYLSSLGVKKVFQGQKRSRRLLMPMLEVFQDKQCNIFLYTNDIKNVSIYQKFGFFVLDEMENEGIECKSWFMYKPYV